MHEDKDSVLFIKGKGVGGELIVWFSFVIKNSETTKEKGKRKGLSSLQALAIMSGQFSNRPVRY